MSIAKSRIQAPEEIPDMATVVQIFQYPLFEKFNEYARKILSGEKVYWFETIAEKAMSDLAKITEEDSPHIFSQAWYITAITYTILKIENAILFWDDPYRAWIQGGICSDFENNKHIDEFRETMVRNLKERYFESHEWKPHEFKGLTFITKISVIDILKQWDIQLLFKIIAAKIQKIKIW